VGMFATLALIGVCIGDTDHWQVMDE
jgi:hypothetical protein